MPVTRTPNTNAVAVLGTSAAVIGSAAPVGTKRTFNNVSFTNTTAGVVTFTVYKVPSAGSPATGNIVISAYQLTAGQSYVPQSLVGLHLLEGMTLQALASAATSINCDANYYDTAGSN